MALEFDGLTDELDYGSITSGNPLMLNWNDATISCWFYQRSGGDDYQRIVDKSTNHTGTNGYNVWCWPSTRQIGLSVNLADYRTGNNAYSLDTWHHVAVTVDSAAGAYAIHVDGSGNIGSGSTYNALPLATANMKHGSWNHSTGREWDGYLAEFAIWTEVLSQDDIEALAGGFAPRYIQPQSLIQYLPMVSNDVAHSGETPTNNGATKAPHLRRVG